MQSANDLQKKYDTVYFINESDYLEGASNPSKAVLLGNLNTTLKKYYQDIDQYGEKSKYVGRILYPERPGRKLPNGEMPKWTYEKNMAFIAGIIDTNRPVILMTDIEFYNNNKPKMTGTITEILWLVDNGYTLKANTSDSSQMALVPPAQPQKDRKLIDYRSEPIHEALARFECIKHTAIKRREQYFGAEQAKIPPSRKQADTSIIGKNRQTTVLPMSIYNKVSDKQRLVTNKRPAENSRPEEEPAIKKRRLNT